MIRFPNGFIAALATLALSAQATQQIVETDNPSVSKSGAGFTNMFIKYGRPHMGSGDYIVTTKGTNSAFEYRIPAGNRSVSAMFLFHNQGQIAEVYVDGHKRATVDTFARSSVAQRMGGVVGQIREVLLASDLDPATNHFLRLVNTATSSSDSHYQPRELNQGPQLAVDALRVGDYAFGTISGVVKDDMGRALGDLRMTLSSPVGPIKDEADRSVCHTDGFGRYSFSGLERGASYTLAIQEQVADYSVTVDIPRNGGELVKNLTVPYVHVSRPRISVPAFALRGGSFQIEVEASERASNWSVRLKNAFKSVALPLNSAAYGVSNILDHSKPGWLLQVTVPTNTPLELWDMEVSCSLGTRREPRCVKVPDTFDRSFYVAQITDVHCYGDAQAKNDLRTAQFLSTLDAIGAGFIAITGDLCHFKGVRQAFDGFNAVLACCSNTPTCVLPGNHDTLVEDSSRGVSRVDMDYNHSLYERLIGPPRYDFHLGNLYVVADDIFSGEPDWARHKFAACTGQNQLRLFLSHYDTLSFEGAPHPAIHLYGHNHINHGATNGVGPNAYPVFSVASVNDDGSKRHPNDFRLVRFNRDPAGQWALGTYTYDGSPDRGVPIAAPMGGPLKSLNLQRTYAWVNDGTQSSNSVAFVNLTAERFEAAAARFVMANGTYAVSGGKVLDSYVSDDQTKRIVLVEFNAAPHATTSASIQPVAATGGTSKK